MKQVFLETNARKALGIHPFGGGLIGLALGVGVMFLVGVAQRDQLTTRFHSEQALAKADFEKRLGANAKEIAELKKYQDCTSTTLLVSSIVSSVQSLDEKVKAFPVLKTEPYKGHLAELTAQSKKQRLSYEGLRDALQGDGVAGPTKCASGAGGGTVLWADEKASFGRDGWSDPGNFK